MTSSFFFLCLKMSKTLAHLNNFKIIPETNQIFISLLSELVLYTPDSQWYIPRVAGTDIAAAAAAGSSRQAMLAAVSLRPLGGRVVKLLLGCQAYLD